MVILGAYEGPVETKIYVADSRTGEIRPLQKGELVTDNHIAFVTNKEGAKKYYQNVKDYVNKAFEK